ncbi:MAG: hypothetical protein ACRD21_26655 [Vicinamibacteria bacterium]
MGVYLIGPESAAVFVSYRRVVEVLGFSSSSSGILPPEKRKLLAKALARIAVHELVHRIAPARPHARAGLMKDRLGGSLLTREHLRLDEESTAGLLSALRSGRDAHLSSGPPPK